MKRLWNWGMAGGATALALIAIFAWRNRGQANPVAQPVISTPAEPMLHPSPTPQPPLAQVVGPTPELMEAHRRALQAKDYSAARSALLRSSEGEVSLVRRAELLQSMLSLNQHVFYNDPTSPDLESYVVRDGDTLTKIARKFAAFHATPGVLKLVNRLVDDRIRVGRKLVIPRGRFSIFVWKSKYRLYLMYEGTAFKDYRVAIGKENATPPSLYIVGEKTSNPTWYPPEHLRDLPRRIPPGDPRNPLGTHWIALRHDVHQGLGIHGTNDPSTLGTNATLGCVRMDNAEVAEIFHVVYPGMEVRIEE